MSKQSDFEERSTRDHYNTVKEAGGQVGLFGHVQFIPNDFFKFCGLIEAPLLAEIESLNAHIKVMQQQLLACLNDVNENLNLTHENESLKHQLANMTALADDASKRCGELQSQINVLRPFYLGPNND